MTGADAALFDALEGRAVRLEVEGGRIAPLG
jgi:hypothetical protein